MPLQWKFSLLQMCIVCLLLFCALASSKVISGQAPWPDIPLSQVILTLSQPFVMIALLPYHILDPTYYPLLPFSHANGIWRMSGHCLLITELKVGHYQWPPSTYTNHIPKHNDVFVIAQTELCFNCPSTIPSTILLLSFDYPQISWHLSSRTVLMFMYCCII